MKRLLFDMAVVLLSCSVSLPTSAHKKDTLLLYSREHIGMEIVTGVDGQQYTCLTYPKLTYKREAGHPELPHQHITLSIPANATNVTLHTVTAKTTKASLSYKIYPTQWTKITSSSWKDPSFAKCDSAIYACEGGFPREVAHITDISGYTDTEKRVGIDIYPVKYFPTGSRCEMYGNISLSLYYELLPKPSRTTIQTASCPTDLPLYEYCIITSRRLEKAFDRLRGWIRQKGKNAGIVCVEDILADPNIKGDTVSNLNDDAGKIRQYLQYGYKYGGTKYVLFGGNDNIVPIRYGTGQRDRWDYFAEIDGLRIPSDFYFAELNSNWNVDGDKYFGEPHSLMDYKAELSIGRISCASVQEIANYTEKLLCYEMNPGMGDYSYLHKAFLSQADGMQEKDEAHKVANEIVDIYPDTTIISEIPDGSDWNPTFPKGNDVINELSKHYGYVTWINHGEPPFVITKMNGYEAECKNAIVATSEFHSPEIYKETNNSLDCLRNKNYPMIAYGIACHVAAFDNHKKDIYGNYANFARSFTTLGEYGGPAFIGNTRIGYEDSTYYVQLYFNKYMRKYPIGESLNMAKLFNPDKTDLHHHSLLINVIGCPDLNIWTKEPIKQQATIEYGQNSVNITPFLYSDSTYISVCPLCKGNKTYSIPMDLHNETMSITEAENCLITLTGRNCLPKVMPLTLQNTTVSGDNYIQVTNVHAGCDIRNGEYGKVVFESGSNTVIEKSGTITLSKGVTIKKGAQLNIKHSSVRK